MRAFWPVSRLNSVVLPTLGLPTNSTNGISDDGETKPLLLAISMDARAPEGAAVNAWTPAPSLGQQDERASAASVRVVRVLSLAR